MSTTQIIRIIDRDQIIAGFVRVRKEWEDAIETDDLLSNKASVGLLLIDLTEAIGLRPDEQVEALGHNLSEIVTPVTA
jgi:hypothetical protein